MPRTLLLFGGLLMISACALIPRPIAVDCGPLADSPEACDSAVDFALGEMSLTLSDVSAVRIEEPATDPACNRVNAGHTCMQPEVVVEVLKDGADRPSEVLLVSDSTGWVNFAQLR